MILLMVNVFALIIGMLMDDFIGTLLAATLMFPLMKEIGAHSIHFAAILGNNLGLGNKTPPTALSRYFAGRTSNCSLDKIIKPQMIFIFICSVPVVLITTYFPFLYLWLPHLFMPKLVPAAHFSLG